MKETIRYIGYGFRNDEFDETIECIEFVTGMSNENYGARNARMNY